MPGVNCYAEAACGIPSLASRRGNLRRTNRRPEGKTVVIWPPARMRPGWEMALTNEQQIAFEETRTAICLRLKNGYCFTDSMLERLSLFELLNLLMLVSGARNYLGLFTATWTALSDVFGDDALQEKPKHCKRQNGTERRWFRTREEAETVEKDPVNVDYHGDVAELCEKCRFWHPSSRSTAVAKTSSSSIAISVPDISSRPFRFPSEHARQLRRCCGQDSACRSRLRIRAGG